MKHKLCIRAKGWACFITGIACIGMVVGDRVSVKACGMAC